jgi:hypothetical protein
MTTELFNTLTSIGSIVFLFGSIVNTLYLFIDGSYRSFVKKYGLVLLFSASLCAMLGSLTYSLIIGYPACDLCWYQRISLYPIVFMSILALYKKEISSLPYMLTILAPGLIISLYHNFIYYTGYSPLPCSAYGQGVSCTVRYVFEYGFITIPLMALSVFLFLGSTILLMKKK